MDLGVVVVIGMRGEGSRTAEIPKDMKGPTPPYGSLRQSKLDRTKITTLPFTAHSNPGNWQTHKSPICAPQLQNCG